jgi:hypothetical protein
MYPPNKPDICPTHQIEELLHCSPTNCFAVREAMRIALIERKCGAARSLARLGLEIQQSRWALV